MSTKEKIIASALEVFRSKGYSGARMQEIADNCGINKALLHYHFQNKETLFKEVFLVSFKALISTVISTLSAPGSLKENVQQTVDAYMAELIRTPDLPRFVLSELKNNEQFVETLMAHSGPFRSSFATMVEESIRAGELRPMKPIDVLADVLGLCAFPILAQPMLQRFSDSTDEEYQEYLDARTKHIKTILLAGLFLENKS